jgi:cytochrome c1
MNRILQFLFPALMLVGIFISAFAIATSLQAASSSGTSPLQTPVAPSTNSSELAAQGRALFVAKGCIVCHRMDQLAALRRAMGDFDFDDVPNLSNLKIDAAYLKRWLHDPQALKPATTMPNLNLSESEIDALVAFLTASK